MYWLRLHYHVRDIAEAPYRIKQKTEVSAVVGRQQLYCAVQSRSPNHCQMMTEEVQSYSSRRNVVSDGYLQISAFCLVVTWNGKTCIFCLKSLSVVVTSSILVNVKIRKCYSVSLSVRMIVFMLYRHLGSCQHELGWSANTSHVLTTLRPWNWK